MRISSRLAEYVASEAHRTRRAAGAVVQSLAEEAMRCRLFPGIAFRGIDWSRRAWVIGTGLDVWEIVQAMREIGSVAEAIRSTDLAERHVRLAEVYAATYPAEIDEAIAENRASIDELRRRYPTFEVA